MNHGYVISDLHLLAERSSADKYLEKVYHLAQTADFLVLNGDIFDFRWSTLDNLEQSIDSALKWLDNLAGRFPNCCVFYIMGNHDGLADFARHLDKSTPTIPNLEWHSSHIRIGNALFFHGDLLLRPHNNDPFQRKLKQFRRQKGRFANRAYRHAVSLRLHTLTAHLHWPRACATRILQGLKKHNPQLSQGVTDIYFGHTHVAFSDYYYHGIYFHNSGAAIKGVDCEVLAVCLDTTP